MIFKPKKGDSEGQQATQKPSAPEEQRSQNTLKTLFESMPPKQKRTVILVMLISAVMLLAYIITLSSPDKKTEKKMSEKEKRKYSLLTEKVERDIWVTSQGHEVKELKAQIEILEGKIAQLTSEIERVSKEKKEQKSQQQGKSPIEKVLPPGFPPLPAPIPPATQKTKGQDDIEINNYTEVPLPDGVTTVNPTTRRPSSTGQKPQEKKPDKKIRIFENEQKSDDKKTTKKEDKVKTAWIPAGAIIKARLLTGMDAPTQPGASGQPLPVAMVITDPAILPNNFLSDFTHCMVIGAGWGDLASERAYIRTETLSCITAKGRAFEIGLKGHVYGGNDGKAGVRGRYVSKQGQQIAMALLAGTISSMGSAFTPQTGIQINVDDAQSRNTNFLQTGQNAFFGGLGQAAKSVADFYLKLAEQMYPVIEIDAGRNVEIVVLKGQEVKIKEI